MKMYKYSGAGNLFVVLDGRDGGVERFREAACIAELCRQHGTDGLMILDRSDSCDFKMEFYNPDGSGGMMCGNGGRCIAAFADRLGIRPAAGEELVFEAADGLHTARILAREGDLKTVRLKMVDVKDYRLLPDGYFLNTGTRHFVTFVPDVEAVDVAAEGPRHRWRPDFAPEGANANFVSVHPDGLHVRTFEKGVEGETLACGTGITASAIAAWLRGIPCAAAPAAGTPFGPASTPGGDASRHPGVRFAHPSQPDGWAPPVHMATGGHAPGPGNIPAGSGRRASCSVDFPVGSAGAASSRVTYAVRARQDWLSVDFLPGPAVSSGRPLVPGGTSLSDPAPRSDESLVASEVYLTGPTELLSEI